MNENVDLGRRALRALTERGLLRRWPGLLIACGDHASERWRLIDRLHRDDDRFGGGWVSYEGDVYADAGSVAPASLTLAITQGWVDVNDEASRGVLLAAARHLWGDQEAYAHPSPDTAEWLVAGKPHVRVGLPGHERTGPCVGTCEASALIAAIESTPVRP